MEARVTLRRREAQALGLETYFTGKPCKNGHLVERDTKTANCPLCVRERVKNWKAANPDKVSASSRRRRQNPTVQQRDAEYRLMNKSRKALLNKKHYIENSDAYKIRAKQQRLKNPEIFHEKQKLYYSKNKSIYVERSIRRARRLERASFPHERSEIQAVYANRPADHHVDHIVPIHHKLVCGLHVLSNLQYLPSKDNRTKSNLWDPDW